MRSDRLGELRQETVDMFYHGWTNYMEHAFPEDEVSCARLGLDVTSNQDISLTFLS
jgi:hypothetical protein